VFRFQNKRLIAFLFISIFLLSIFIPHFRKYLIDLNYYSFKIVDFVFQEIKALIFFHYNYIENKILFQKLGALKQEMAEQKELLIENQRLKDMLSFKQDFPYRLVSARIIFRDPDNWSSFVLIDRGEKEKLKENLAVVSSMGLVGKIREVNNFCAKVILLTDPQFCVSAIIQRSRQQGLVCGTLENYLVMRYLDENIDVKIDDIVITAGLTELFPKGIVIGKVIKINKDPLLGGYYLKIKPAVDFSKLEEVMIILKQ